MGRELDDEVSVEGYTDSLQQRDRRHDTTGFQTGEGGLGHLSAGCEFDLGQPQGQAAFADRLADQERPAGFGRLYRGRLSRACDPVEPLPETGIGMRVVELALPFDRGRRLTPPGLRRSGCGSVSLEED